MNKANNHRVSEPSMFKYQENVFIIPWMRERENIKYNYKQESVD